MTTKTCFKCGQSKDEHAFYKNAGMSDGRMNKCIDCAKKEVGNRYHVKKEIELKKATANH